MSRITYEGHHIWCNYPIIPVEKCEYCKKAFEKYPIKEDETPEEMALRYFPGIIVRK